MKWITQFVVVSAAVALGTWFGGWWMVPVVGALYGAWGVRQHLTTVTALLAGIAGWGALLALTAMSGPAVGRLLGVLGALLHMPGRAFVVLTLAYGGLLAVTAAAAARGLRRMVTPASVTPPA